MKLSKKYLLLLSAVMLLLLCLCGCAAQPARYTKQYYSYFDTTIVITGYDSQKEFDKACSIAEDVFDSYNRLCDIYHEYSGVCNARSINLSAGGAPLTVDPQLMELLSYGRDMYYMTGGECSIVMGAVLSQWHECRTEALDGGAARLPDNEALFEGSLHCHMEDLLLDEENCTVQLLDPDMSLDLGSLAKGWAAEKAAQALERAGYTGYALNLGGNVRTIGCKKPGEPWIGGIENPMDISKDAIVTVKLDNMSLVTSGSYLRFYTVHGINYHHIICPETLYPRNEFVSVSILTQNSALGDILSTALFNMTEADGRSLAETLGAEVFWVYPDGSTARTDGFSAYIAD